MPKFSSLFCYLFLAFWVNTVDSAPADKKKSGETQQIISSQEAINQVKKKTGGKVLGVKLRNKGDKSIYKVRVLTDKKRVKNVSVNANKSKSNNKKPDKKKNDEK